MKELMHTTPEGLTGADATWAAGVMERDRAQRNAAIARAERAEAEAADWKQALNDWKTRHAEVLSKAELGYEFERVRQHILGMDSKGGAETVIDAYRFRGEKIAEVTKERDALARRVEGTPLRCQTIERFRESHPRLRDPFELEPAPEPKTSLPVVPATCGECEHVGGDMSLSYEPWCAHPSAAKGLLGGGGTKAGRDLALGTKPTWCPLRKPSDELRSKETT